MLSFSPFCPPSGQTLASRRTASQLSPIAREIRDSAVIVR
jgi:hypothetical protein